MNLTLSEKQRPKLPDEQAECFFYDKAQGLLSSYGCSLISSGHSYIICSCTHMTDFVGIFRKGKDVLKNSNYDVISQATDITAQGLSRNIGYFFALGYIISYFILLIVFNAVDRRKLKSKFYESLFLLIQNISLQHKAKSEEEASKTKQLDEKDKGLSGPYVPKYKRSNPFLGALRGSAHHGQTTSKSQIIKEIEAGQPCEYRLDSHLQVESMGEESSTDSLDRHRRSTRFAIQHPSFAVITDSVGKDLSPKERKQQTEQEISSRVDRIKFRILSVIEANHKKSPCCLCAKLTLNELETNNQIYNLIAKTSPLNKRTVRLSLCYFALLLELTLCALFFNIAPSQDEDQPLFWDRIIENFWVALYSVIFSLFPLLLLGLLFSVPKKWLVVLQQAHQVGEVKDKFRSISKQLYFRMVAGFVIFTVLTLFLLLYIVSFCHVAGLTTSVDWLISSSISILIDQIAFELCPALAVGFLGTLKSCCKKCKGVLFVIVAIEIYRLYRNLIEG